MKWTIYCVINYLIFVGAPPASGQIYTMKFFGTSENWARGEELFFYIFGQSIFGCNFSFDSVSNRVYCICHFGDRKNFSASAASSEWVNFRYLFIIYLFIYHQNFDEPIHEIQTYNWNFRNVLRIRHNDARIM